MGQVYLTIAQSLDGYIADDKGSWRFLFERPRHESDADYAKFFSEIGMILFGKVSYRQMLEDAELGGGAWAYPGKRCVVFNHAGSGEDARKFSGPVPPPPEVEFTSLSAKQFMEQVGGRETKPIWLFGGKKLIKSFMDEDLVDHYWIYTMPVILGGGVPLFIPDHVKRDLDLTYSAVIDGFRVKHFYTRVRDPKKR
jgi:dihydrofolate reductase